ncbi:MAG: Mrp/NBP35 family ATP-binding protein [Bacteroidales bacterium]|nr:Mrp/NBP35 family ATP-binding protein [Bacteroidales bacterium]
MKEQIVKILMQIPIPGEKGSVVEFVRNVEEKDGSVVIRMGLPQKYDKYERALVSSIQDAVKRAIANVQNVEVLIDIIKANDTEATGGVSKVKNVIAVASGKGGVGKSTVSANLAVSLSKMGYKVGLLDADIFGPSIPKMFGVEHAQPLSKKEGDKEWIMPIEQYGIKLLSIGFFVRPEDALAWRGPMAGNVLKQFVEDSDWGELDVLVIDMPPGTSDIQLTLCQILNITGAIMVGTPQDVAVIDVVKAIDFFSKEKIEVPILGLIENMAWFTPKELPENKYYIFGKGGIESLAYAKGLPFLGSVPIVMGIREGGDSGKPAALNDNSMIAQQFHEIAGKLVGKLS